MAKYTREPINGFTHLFGAILSFAGLLILVIKTTLENPSPDRKSTRLNSSH